MKKAKRYPSVKAKKPGTKDPVLVGPGASPPLRRVPGCRVLPQGPSAPQGKIFFRNTNFSRLVVTIFEALAVL